MAAADSLGTSQSHAPALCGADPNVSKVPSLSVEAPPQSQAREAPAQPVTQEHADGAVERPDSSCDAAEFGGLLRDLQQLEAAFLRAVGKPSALQASVFRGRGEFVQIADLERIVEALTAQADAINESLVAGTSAERNHTDAAVKVWQWCSGLCRANCSLDGGVLADDFLAQHAM